MDAPEESAFHHREETQETLEKLCRMARDQRPPGEMAQFLLDRATRLAEGMTLGTVGIMRNRTNREWSQDDLRAVEKILEAATEAGLAAMEAMSGQEPQDRWAQALQLFLAVCSQVHLHMVEEMQLHQGSFPGREPLLDALRLSQVIYAQVSQGPLEEIRDWIRAEREREQTP